MSTIEYKRILIVASDIASAGVNWNHMESATIFGDGAAAAIVEKTPEAENSSILYSEFATFSSGRKVCQIRGGGTRLGNNYEDKTSHLFEMEGRKVFKLSSQILPAFLSQCVEKAGLEWNDLDLVISHQASPAAMELIRRKLKVKKEKWFQVVEQFGNQVAASIPNAIHEAVKRGRLKRGDRVLLLGSAAGLSVAGVILEY